MTKPPTVCCTNLETTREEYSRLVDAGHDMEWGSNLGLFSSDTDRNQGHHHSASVHATMWDGKDGEIHCF